MKNKKIFIAIGIIIILFAGYFLLNGNVGSDMPQMYSLKNLLSSNKPQTCTFVNSENGSETDGTVYISNGKMRGDFNSDVMGKIMRTHMILMNNTNYIWIEGESQGFKITMGEDGQQNNTKDRGLDFDKEMNYECKNWNEEASQFLLPSDVNFSDFSDMLKVPSAETNSGAASGVSADQCNACNSAPEPSRTQCRNMLGCK